MFRGPHGEAGPAPVQQHQRWSLLRPAGDQVRAAEIAGKVKQFVRHRPVLHHRIIRWLEILASPLVGSLNGEGNMFMGGCPFFINQFTHT